jgi:electron transfer flavoprotein alpha subunit
VSRRALVVVEPRAGRVPAGQLGVLSAAARVCDAVEVLLPVAEGDPVEELVGALGSHGAVAVRVVTELPATSAPRVAVVAALHAEEPYDLVAFESSSLSADVAGALAVRLDAGVCWDLSGLDDVDGELVGRRLALADSMSVDVGWVGGPAVALFRTAALDAVRRPDGDPPRVMPVQVPAEAGPDVVLLETPSGADAVPSGLDTADIVVAGGRGLGSRENIALLEELAAVLGGVVGVSMPVVDRGWYPYAHQVGQTGRTVRPRLYLACGISGAVQHRVGMSRSGTVIAINTDPQAPIFDVCDLGVVGDLTEVVPRITALLRERS